MEGPGDPPEIPTAEVAVRARSFEEQVWLCSKKKSQRVTYSYQLLDTAVQAALRELRVVLPWQ